MSQISLITGADGFIGSHLVDDMNAMGIPTRALVQPGREIVNLPKKDANIFQGDIRDKEIMKRAMEDVDVVYHLAAISRYDANVPDQEYYATNVEGTRNILTAAQETGVRKVLFTSTIEAVGMSADGNPLTESTPQHPRNIYGKTKYEAEQLVCASNGAGGVETVVVRPPMTYGPREMLLLARMFKVIEKGVFPLIGSGQALTEFCYIKNQTQGIRLVAERGRPGEVYFISGERPYSIEEIVRSIAQEMGVGLWTPHVPVSMALCIGFVLEKISKILRFYPFLVPQTGRPPFSRKSVEWLSQNRLYVDMSKARRDLEYEPVYDLKSGIQETIKWYQDNHLLH